MNDFNPDEDISIEWGDEGNDAVWANFEAVLSNFLKSFAEHTESNHLVLKMTNPNSDEEEGCAPYIQFASFASGEFIRAEISGNSWLLPQYQLNQQDAECLTLTEWQGNDPDAGEPNWFQVSFTKCISTSAGLALWTLRTCFGLAHPQLLTFESWGPAAPGAAALGLCASDEVPSEAVDPKSTPEPLDPKAIPPERVALAVVPSSREDLLDLIGRVLQTKYDCEPTVDEDEDFVLHHLGQSIWVRARADEPAVEIMSLVARQVRSRRQAAIETTLLNRDHLWVQWNLHGREIWQTVRLPGSPFTPHHFSVLLDRFREDMKETRDDLILRTGAVRNYS